MMGCSNAIVIREIQNKIALRFHSTSFKLAKLERWIMPSVGWDWGYRIVQAVLVE